MILTRKPGEEVRLKFDGREILVVLVAVKGKQVRIGFECDPDIQIDRPDSWKMKKLAVAEK